MRDEPLKGFKLIGEDGNSFAIIGRFTRCARRAGWTVTERQEVIDAAQYGDYDNLLRVFAPLEDDDDEDNDEEAGDDFDDEDDDDANEYGSQN